MIKKLLLKARDARWMWDLLGQIYNRQIYDAISELYGHIALHLHVDAGNRILDVGTGRGYMALLLAGRHPESSIEGIDFSSMQVRAAERLRRQRDIPNCRYRQADAMALPFEAGRFDAVVSVGSIKHWPDPQRGVAEMGRVLAPGGLAVVSETDREASDRDIRRFMQRFTAWYLWDPLLFWGLRHIIFGESHSRGEIAAFFRAAGFRQVMTERHATCPYVIVTAQK